MCLQQREDERGHLVAELRIRLMSEGHDLRTLHGVEEAELRLHDSGMRLRPAEFGRDRLVQVDDILHAEVANAAVSRGGGGRRCCTS